MEGSTEQREHTERRPYRVLRQAGETSTEGGGERRAMFEDLGVFTAYGNDEAREQALAQLQEEHMAAIAAGATEEREFDPTQHTLATVADRNWNPKTPKVKIQRSTSWA